LALVLIFRVGALALDLKASASASVMAKRDF